MLPKVKLIVMLRNPVDRAYSHYYDERAGGHEQYLSFEEAIDREEKRLAGELEKMQVDEYYQSYNHRHFSYRARGIYVDQLSTWMKFFPKEQILILESEDFYLNSAAVLKRSLEFLRLPAIAFQEEKKQYK